MSGKSDPKETQDTVQSVITVEALASAIASIAQNVNTLTSKVNELASRPERTNEIPQAVTPDQLLSGIRGLKKGESASGSTFVDKQGRRYKFRTNAVVELIDEEKLKQHRASGKLGDDEKLYGAVLGIMYFRKRDGVAKYRVDFGKTFGDDGLMESQIQGVE
jgi:hypothetical protein